MRKRKTAAVWKYVLLAVVLHLAVLLVPGRIVEVLFPRSAPRDAGPASDLMPNFKQYAIHVVYIDDEEPQVEIRTDPRVEVAPLEPEPEYLEHIRETDVPEAEEQQVDTGAHHGAAGPPLTGEGDEIGEEPGAGGDDGIIVIDEPVFYPPVPRLIVPPSVQNLDLKDLTITLQILVNKWGRPMEVIIVNAPEDEVVYDRIMEAARQFRFLPARRGDKPVEAWIELPLNLETTRRD